MIGIKIALVCTWAVVVICRVLILILKKGANNGNK